MSVACGIDVLRSRGFDLLRGKRVGLLTNPSGVDRELVSTYEILSGSADVDLVALFSPEHGFAGAVADGIHVSSSVDHRTGLPVHSLYGSSLHPTQEMLSGIDVIVCDIQDIGVRFYTFVWTMTHMLDASGLHGVELIVLDRPNPLGGEWIQGPLLYTNFASLVGRFPVPIVHGMTVGEMLLLVNSEWNQTPAQLQVVPVEGWRRSMPWQDTGLEFVPPSPNVPKLSTLLQYPGACLVEGTTLSEGRGTALPFEIVGAPWVDAFDLAQVLNGLRLDGVRFRAHTFVPTASKHKGEFCGGVQVHITNKSNWNPVKVWLAIILTIRNMYPENFEWLQPAVGSTLYHFDRLIGTDGVRLAIESGESPDQFLKKWAEDEGDFRSFRRPYLLYE